MRTRRLGRPSPALLVSVIALVVALGGTSYAAFSLPRGSVGTKQLKRGAVTNAKIHRGAVTGSKIKRGSITGADINFAKLGTVPSAADAATVGGRAVRWLLVDPNGAIVGQSGGFAVQNHVPGSGVYIIYAGALVSGHAFIATSAFAGGDNSPRGPVVAGPCGLSPGAVDCHLVLAKANDGFHIAVATEDAPTFVPASAGNPPSVATNKGDHSFYLLMY